MPCAISYLWLRDEEIQDYISADLDIETAAKCLKGII
jgi:hypothetical protein